MTQQLDRRTTVERFADRAGIDLPRGSAQPSPWRFAVALVVAVVGSLVACWLIATASIALLPSLRGYDHFRFADYAKLTVIGVVIASLAWPVVCWFSTRAARILAVLAVLVTIASFAPDVWIGIHGQPAAGVLALAVMHVALLLVTYPALVLIAPQRRPGRNVPRR
ncbi:MAG: hypothetical protein ACTHJL_08430 [Amnibacterium sp.]